MSSGVAYLIRRIRGTAAFANRDGDGLAEVAIDDAGLRFGQGANVRTAVDLDSTQTITGTKTLSGTTTLSGATTISGAATFSAATVGLRTGIEVTDAATDSLTAAESGKVFICTATSGTQVFTLPATVAGVTYTFVAASADGEINVSPNASDKIQGKGITAADNKDYINTAATNAVGDLITIVGDGTDGWWVLDERGTWGREG